MQRFAWIVATSVLCLACGSEPIDLGSTSESGTGMGDGDGDPTPVGDLDPEGPYAPCSEGTCPQPAVCNVDEWPDPNFGMCAPTCQSATDCPVVEGATVDCFLGGGSGYCAITCASDDECPAGTQCAGEGMLCLWPA